MNRAKLLRVFVGMILACSLVTPVLFMSLPAQATTQLTLKVIDGAFEPSERKINVGTQVQWWSPDCNTRPGDCSTLDHSVEGPDHSGGPAINVLLHPGDYSGYFTFSSLGTYIYKDNHSNAGQVQIDVVNGSTDSPAPSATATITRTVTVSPTATHSSTGGTGSTNTPAPSHSASPSASPSPSPSPTPTQTPTESPSASSSAIIAESGPPAASSGKGNTIALIAILAVLGLGSAGFLIYRRTIS